MAVKVQTLSACFKLKCKQWDPWFTCSCFSLLLPDFVRHQSIPIQSLSGDIFSFKEDIFVAMAAPNSNSCVIMEWDHIEMNFRKFDNITGLTVHSLNFSCFTLVEKDQDTGIKGCSTFKDIFCIVNRKITI